MGRGLKETKVEINDRGILLIGFLVLALVFALGFMCNNKAEASVTFTSADIAAIDQAMEMYGNDIEVRKEDGRLVITIGDTSEN